MFTTPVIDACSANAFVAACLPISFPPFPLLAQFGVWMVYAWKQLGDGSFGTSFDIDGTRGRVDGRRIVLLNGSPQRYEASLGARKLGAPGKSRRSR